MTEPAAENSSRAKTAEDAIAALRPSIIASLRVQTGELKKFREKIADGALNDDERDAMRRAVHDLRGAAAAYFYPNVAVAAGPLEIALKGDVETGGDVLSALTEKLITLCEAALEEG